FGYINGQSFTGSFELIMSYGNGFSTATDIYYYNEINEQWEVQNGTMNTDHQTISIHPEHFSTYGVFALKEDDEQEDDAQEDEEPSIDDESKDDDPKDDEKSDWEDDLTREEKDTTTEATEDRSDVHTGTDKNDKILPKTATSTFNLIVIGLI